MLEKFITSALIIDDQPKEVEKLISYLTKRDIWVKHYTPEQISNENKQFNNRKIIFLDLFLVDENPVIENIALIRKYFTKYIGKDFGTYGIVLWTKHTDHLEEFSKKIHSKNNPFTTPLFVIGLDKTKFIRQGNFDGIIEELEKELNSDLSASFFVQWNKSVKNGSDRTIQGLYDLFETHEIKKRNLEALLFSLACNYTGIPKQNVKNYDLQKDLVKSLMDVLQFEVSSAFLNIDTLFSDPNRLNFNDTKDEKTRVYSKLNTFLMLDSQNLAQESPMPGNIYKIQDKSSPLFISKILDRKNQVCNLNEHEDFKNVKKTAICIEVTPPCDFAENKRQLFSRVVGGIMMDYNKDLKNRYFKGDGFYSFLMPISIDGFDKPQMIIFDFYRFQTLKEDILKDKSMFPIILKAKDKLFADILQKLSSHTARLGIAIMKP